MKLTIRQSDGIDDWWVIERAEHDGRTWYEKTQWGSAYCTSARIVEDHMSDVEGPGSEMLEIAEAIEQRGTADNKRCAVDARSDVVFFWSPRNSNDAYGQCSVTEATELAKLIRSKITR